MNTYANRKTSRDSDHPYLDWYALMYRNGSRFHEERNVVSERDFILSPVASARFGLNMDPDGELSLGILQDDLAAILSLQWRSAAFARGLRGKNYVILSCPDVTDGWPDGPPGGSGVDHRIFIQVSEAYADALIEADPQPSVLRLRAMMLTARNVALLSKGEPRRELPFSYVAIM